MMLWSGFTRFAAGGLLSGTILASGVFVSHGALAQDASALQAIQQQITQLQTQLRQLQREAAQRDAELRRARDEAGAARSEARRAVQQTSAPPAAAVVAPPVVVAAAPPAAPAPTTPSLPPGTFDIGGVRVTLGGFVAAEGVYRQRNEAASVDTSFNGIPFANSANHNIPEYRATAQQSRLSLLAQANIDDAQKLTTYVETDFLSAGSSSNSNQSNSYTLRLRQFWGQYDNNDYGLHLIGGQGWSLATLYKNGLLPRSENVPLTIDAQYVVGFNWERQAQFRLVKDFDDRKYSAALGIEEPQTLFGSSAGPNCLTGANTTTGIGGGTLEYAQCGGSNVNSVQAYSDNVAPDIIAKVAADPGYGHYELYGLLRFLSGRVSANGGGQNYTTTGQGIGAGMILPVLPGTLDFQVSGLAGQGVGRYGSGQIADATFSPTGKIEPLSEYSLFGGFVAHPIPQLDIYAYAGTEHANRKFYTAGSVQGGYGNPNVSLGGCSVELGACSANTATLAEGTLGAWYRVLQSKYGTMQVGAQYEYINRLAFAGLGAAKGTTASPSTNENAFLVSLRFMPFN